MKRVFYYFAGIFVSLILHATPSQALTAVSANGWTCNKADPVVHCDAGPAR